MIQSELANIKKKKHEAWTSRKGLLVSMLISLVLWALILLGSSPYF